MKTKKDSSPTETVLAIGKIEMSGNIVPHSWYESIIFKNGKPDLAAIIILSEIIWWYRPREVFDKKTHKFLGYERKFAGDKLQYGHKQFAQKFGLSARQSFRACKSLKDKKLITIELRTVKIKSGDRLGNVMFVEPIPEKVLEITHPENFQDISKSTPTTLECNRVLHSNVVGYDIRMQDPITLECNTYTKNTTENTTKITTDIGAPQNGADAPPSNKNKKGKKYSFTETHVKAAKWFYDSLKVVVPDLLPPKKFDAWANDFRKMIEIDKRQKAKIVDLVNWLTTSEHKDAQFWIKNVQCPATLREKFSKLSATMEQAKRQKDVNGKSKEYHQQEREPRTSFQQPVAFAEILKQVGEFNAAA